MEFSPGRPNASDLTHLFKLRKPESSEKQKSIRSCGFHHAKIQRNPVHNPDTLGARWREIVRMKSYESTVAQQRKLGHPAPKDGAAGAGWT